MALEFCVNKLEKDSNNRHYVIEVRLNGKERAYRYIVRTDAHLYFVDSLSIGLNFSVLDGNDCPFRLNGNGFYDGEGFDAEIIGMAQETKEDESRFKSALCEFVRTKCSEEIV